MKGRKRKRKRKKKVKYRKRKWWKKCKESIVSLFTYSGEKNVKEKECKKRARRPKVRKTLRKTWRWLFLLLLQGQS